MAGLYSQYFSGTQLLAGPIAGSVLGASGLNPIVDRLNSISTDDGIYSNLGSGVGISIGAGSVVELTNKTSYQSVRGCAFMAENETKAYTLVNPGTLNVTSTNTNFYTDVNLPHNSVITEFEVFGVGTSQILISRGNNDSNTNTTLGTIQPGSSVVLNHTVDNANSTYQLRLNSWDSGDVFYSAKITYTTDYD